LVVKIWPTTDGETLKRNGAEETIKTRKKQYSSILDLCFTTPADLLSLPFLFMTDDLKSRVE
jgi:hypothetical protein